MVVAACNCRCETTMGVTPLMAGSAHRIRIFKTISANYVLEVLRRLNCVAEVKFQRLKQASSTVLGSHTIVLFVYLLVLMNLICS